MLNLFKSKAEKTDQPKETQKKPQIKIIQAQPKPGQSMEDFMTEMQAQHGGGGDLKQGNISDMFKLLGKDAAKVLKDSGVDVEELIASGVISREDVPDEGKS